MSHKKITEEQLTSFLYGEISGAERQEVEDYLKENPARQKEMEEMGKVRAVLAHYKDEEGIQVPEFRIVKDKNEINKWKYLAIAASVTLLISLGWIGVREINNTSDQANFASLTDDKINELAVQQEKLLATNEALVNKINDLEQMMNKVDQDQKAQLAVLTTLQNRKNEPTLPVEEYLVALNDQNRKILSDYFITAENNQKQYLLALLTDFAGYIDQQREQDLQVILTRIQTLEQNTGEFQYAAAQLMASLTNSEVQYQNQ